MIEDRGADEEGEPSGVECRETDGAMLSPQGAGDEGRRLHQPKDEAGHTGGTAGILQKNTPARVGLRAWGVGVG